MAFADAHLHMTDPEFKGYRDMDKAKLLFSCSTTKSEWNSLKALSKNDDRTVCFYGTHPWFPKEHDERLLEKILNEDGRACVGEIGLDGLHPDPELQREIFINQLRIAGEYGRTASVHAIRAEKELLEILRSVKPLPKVILHSFRGPESYIHPFTDHDCFFSVSARTISKSPDNIRGLLKAIPDDRLLFETDSPHTPATCPDMSSLICKTAEIISDEPKRLESLALSNARRLIP